MFSLNHWLVDLFKILNNLHVLAYGVIIFLKIKLVRKLQLSIVLIKSQILITKILEYSSMILGPTNFFIYSFIFIERETAEILAQLDLFLKFFILYSDAIMFVF
jgi:hypothetical protein